MPTKYIFVTGGVVSSLGKGITAASLGRLLKNRGLKVWMQKFDPYINIDPGTMNPYQHGEVYVTDDGAETDLDLGHYERFIDESLSQESNVTSGRVYWDVLTRERKGEYLGATIQVIPHITNEIKSRMMKVSQRDNPPDVIITEIGGVVGDIESLPFLEAARQLRAEVGRENCLFIHVTLVPYISVAGELKTKPTQHSVKEMTGLGIQPDIIVCRCEKHISKEARDKIGLFCNIAGDCVFESLDADSIYQVPLTMHEEGLDACACKLIGISTDEPDMTNWSTMVHNLLNPEESVQIAVVGKYVELPDAYLSIAESLHHAGIANNSEVKIKWIQAEDVTERNIASLVKDCSGILVPGGFGSRGLDGKMIAIKYARENDIPFFGICLGMQMAVIEYARNVLGYSAANTTEVDPETEYPVICLMPDQEHIDDKGGTMRLGAYNCYLIPGSNASKIYGTSFIKERHRHRYEFNNEFLDQFTKTDVSYNRRMVVSGLNPDRNLVEIVEIPDHPWFVGVQYHPELKSRPNHPHPLFVSFVNASLNYKEKII